MRENPCHFLVSFRCVNFTCQFVRLANKGLVVTAKELTNIIIFQFFRCARAGL